MDADTVTVDRMSLATLTDACARACNTTTVTLRVDTAGRPLADSVEAAGDRLDAVQDSRSPTVEVRRLTLSTLADAAAMRSSIADRPTEEIADAYDALDYTEASR